MDSAKTVEKHWKSSEFARFCGRNGIFVVFAGREVKNVEVGILGFGGGMCVVFTSREAKKAEIGCLAWFLWVTVDQGHGGVTNSSGGVVLEKSIDKSKNKYFHQNVGVGIAKSWSKNRVDSAKTVEKRRKPTGNGLFCGETAFWR